jgi:hypothetical protein
MHPQCLQGNEHTAQQIMKPAQLQLHKQHWSAIMVAIFKLLFRHYWVTNLDGNSCCH